MSERKVLNKYYPPDFDPSKIPRMKLARNRQYTVRLMAPFNMRCKTCGEYIYKGKKFNARKEDVEDPKNTDYEIEAGATRNFMALKLAEEQAQREEDEEKEEEATNPMKLLEKRTLQSKQELELLESLEELKDLNRRQQTIDYDQMLEQFDTEAVKQRTEKEQEEYDEQYVKTVFRKKIIVEEEILELDENENDEPPKKMIKKSKNKSENNKVQSVAEQEKPKETQRIKPSETSLWSESTPSSSNRKNLLGIVKKKTNLVNTKVNSKSTITSTDKEKTETVTREEADASKEKSTNLKINTSESTYNSTGNNNNGLSLLGAYSGSSDNDSN
ncbi:hypothetical protein QLX08_004231 [Tetragonisca angustula]|uniref:Splicing factor YJU2 n=1 Tax=Tetragonisca angustula TaxID=166442 RepID=A0AAW1A3G9_9HYME